MKTKIYLIILIIVSLVPMVDLLHPGLPLTHDGQDHVARIANFYKNIEEGNIIPRWAGNLNWGYGHPILMFLYPLPSYSTSFFHFFGFSFVDSVKLVFGLSFILSGLTMYLWTKTVWGKEAGFVAAVLYIFAPYRFVDLYVRGAIGEHVAFIFPPLVLYFIYKLSKEFKSIYIIFGALSMGGFILAHNAISIMFMPLIVLYSLYLAISLKEKIKFLFGIGIMMVFGYGVSAFFWVPAFFEGKYTLRDIVTKNEYLQRFVNVKDLVFGAWNYGGTGQFTVQIGILHWSLSIAAVWLLLKKRKKDLLLWGLLLSFLGTLFLMTSYSKPIWHSITTLQKFQFPWRFLSVTVFVTSALGAVVFCSLQKSYQRKILVLIAIILLVITKDYWKANGFLQKDESFYSSVYNGTTDTGESAPIWSVRFMEKRPRGEIEILEGSATVERIRRTSTIHEYSINAGTPTRLKENTLYFPGWEVRVDNNSVPIEFQDRKHHGIMTFFVKEGKHTIVVEFKETKLRKVANAITVASLAILGAYSILKVLVWRRFQLF